MEKKYCSCGNEIDEEEDYVNRDDGQAYCSWCYEDAIINDASAINDYHRIKP